jgi:hypothetical protein
MAKKKDDRNITDAFKDVRKISGKQLSGSKDSEGKISETELIADDVLGFMSEILPPMPDIPGVSREDKAKMLLTTLLVKLGVTPEEYSESYGMVNQLFGVLGKTGSRANPRDMDFDDDFSTFDMLGPGMRRGYVSFTTYEPMPDAAEKTLVLKIQMRGVTKPPMWREVEVPADYNFAELHDVIQIVTGLENSHLWQFNKSAYDDSLQIGIPMDHDDPYGFGLESVTDVADETPLTKYLAQKGDELEYVYDFGDDWVFSVKVQKVIDSACESPKCLKWKSDLNALEDFGGPYSYEEIREIVSEDSVLTKKEKDSIAKNYLGWFENKKELMQFLNEKRFDIDSVNIELSGI